MKVHAILAMAVVAAALATTLYLGSRPKPAPPPAPRPFVWSVDMERLKVLAISLSPGGKRESWVKHEDQYWYFDRPGGPKVNMTRWGGGIPLILSGPGADRLIAENATDEQLELYGLSKPGMKIDLTLENGDSIHVEVGDATPNGQANYIRRLPSRVVFSVDHTWVEVLERLVLEPPYPEPEKPKP